MHDGKKLQSTYNYANAIEGIIWCMIKIMALKFILVRNNASCYLTDLYMHAVAKYVSLCMHMH